MPLNDIAKSSDLVNGKLTGGNLTMVQTSIGTSWQIKTKEAKFFFLEDMNVAPFRLDRELFTLKASRVT